jgi:hypothetical protein
MFSEYGSQFPPRSFKNWKPLEQLRDLLDMTRTEDDVEPIAKERQDPAAVFQLG